jgi:F0F1-type ATP synthase membrane subunit b/b'
MSIEEKQEYVAPEGAAPRWVGIIVVALAIVSLAALGTGWTASTRSKELAQSLTTAQQQEKQQEDVLSQRLAKAEDTNAQLQGELSVVTDKMKLTQGELKKARAQASRIKEEDAKQLADLQNNMNGQLATKAGVDDVNKLGTDVNGVKTDLESTKNSLNMTRGEFGTLIAKNHDEVEELRRLGERDYYEFTINKKDQRQKVGDLMIELRGVNPKKNVYTIAMYVDDARYEKKNRSVNEPIYFFTRGTRAPMELTVNQVGKDKIVGYLSVPKSATNTHAQASSGN